MEKHLPLLFVLLLPLLHLLLLLLMLPVREDRDTPLAAAFDCVALLLLSPLRRLPEHYQLSTSLSCPHEMLLPRSTAQLLLQLSLSLHSCTAPLSLLEQLVVKVVTITADYTENTQVSDEGRRGGGRGEGRAGKGGKGGEHARGKGRREGEGGGAGVGRGGGPSLGEEGAHRTGTWVVRRRTGTSRWSGWKEGGHSY